MSSKGTVRGGFAATELPEVSEAERQTIRETYDEVKVKGSQSGGEKRMHILDCNDETLCNHISPNKLVTKTFAQIPRKYWGFCKVCAELWRQENDE